MKNIEEELKVRVMENKIDLDKTKSALEMVTTLFVKDKKLTKMVKFKIKELEEARKSLRQEMLGQIIN